MQSDAPGILAVWNNCAAGHEATYEAWYREEHLPERVGVEGFHFGRRYEAVKGGPRYFTYYVTDSPATLTSPAYMARLEAPTPRTTAVMKGIFIDMVRTVCRRVVARGKMQGGYVVTVRFGGALPLADLTSLAEQAVSCGALRAEGWLADEGPGRPLSAEEKIRGIDGKIASGLLIEAGFEAEALRIAAEFQDKLATQAEIGAYRFLCALTHQELTT